MGLNDTAEQLDVCRQQSLRDEARIRELEQELADAAQLLVEATTLIEHLHRNPRTIDRDALVTALLDALRGTSVPAVPLADRILALVAPGVVPPQSLG